jgi:hypothetical protein
LVVRHATDVSLRVIGFALLTFWWLPLGFLTSLAVIANSRVAALAVSLCLGLLSAACVPRLWATTSVRRTRVLKVARWVLLVVPICYVGTIATLYPQGTAVLPLAVWRELLIAGALLSLPSCIVALVLIAPLGGLKTTRQHSYVIGAAVIGYSAAAYGALLGKIEVTAYGFHVDGVDAVTAAMFLSPSAALLLGTTMMAVVRKEIPAPSR